MLANMPKMEEYGDGVTLNFADAEGEDVKLLLEGREPTPSIRESVYNVLYNCGQWLR